MRQTPPARPIQMSSRHQVCRIWSWLMLAKATLLAAHWCAIIHDRPHREMTFMNSAAAFRLLRACCWLVALGTVLPGASAWAASGTLVMLRNPTNSSPRVVSLWGGAGSEQIILKSDGTVWDWGLNSDGQLGNGNNTIQTNPLPTQVLGSG